MRVPDRWGKRRWRRRVAPPRALSRCRVFRTLASAVERFTLACFLSKCDICLVSNRQSSANGGAVRAQSPDMYRPDGGRGARGEEGKHAQKWPSSPPTRRARHRGSAASGDSRSGESSAFAPHDERDTREMGRGRHEQAPSLASGESVRQPGSGPREERPASLRDGDGYAAPQAQPAPRLVTVEQMYVPADEVEEARRRDALAYRYDLAGLRAEHYEPVRKKRRWKLGLAMFTLGFFVGIVATVGSVIGMAMFVGGQTRAQSQQFSSAVRACKAAPHATVASDGSSLEMNTFGKKQPGMSVATLSCVLQELDAPESLMQRMDTTRAIDGTREETWGPYRATWTYHPDQGLHVVISSK